MTKFEYVDPFVCFCFGGGDKKAAPAPKPAAGPPPSPVTEGAPAIGGAQRSAAGATPTANLGTTTTTKKSLLGE